MNKLRRADIVVEALIEEHLAVQQMMQEAAEEPIEGPSEAAYERLASAFTKAAVVLKEHTVEVPEERS